MVQNVEPPKPPERPVSTREYLEDLVEAATEAGGASGTPGTGILTRDTALGRLLLGRGRPRLLLIVVAALGPGLIAANAGNDAGGIATYSAVGAQFKYSLLWSFLPILVSLSVIQEMAARMGAATGKGLSDLIRENFSIHTTVIVLLALLVANGSTAVSEFVGIAASVDLIIPHAQYIAVPLIAAGLWLLVVRGSYSAVERVLLAMTLVFFAYPISAFLAPHVSWGQVATAMVVPQVHLTQGYLITLVALIGTSITPYMQVYVQSAIADKGVTPRDYLPERVGVYVGSVFAMLIFLFILVATASTLYPNPNITSAAQAAAALGPVAGAYAKYLFAVGLFGASMLAAAVLPLATAYSITEALGVEKGVSAGFREAPVFMGIFTGLIALGALVSLLPLPTIKVLIITQVVDALLLPFVLFSILRLANSRKLMGDMVNGRIYNVIAGAATIIVTCLSIALLIITVLGWFGLGPSGS
jgi:NRAMP (natural resistance-associated macrophage protein)-like metal ion transporter